MKIIEVENLRRDFTTHKGWIKRKKEIIHAVDDISFYVEKGEIFGLLGQNGAGKTTTIKMLITLLAPTSGTCKVLGYKTFGEEKKIRNRINFIFGGETGVYPRLSARDNLKYFANLYHIEPKESNKRIAELLELVGLSDKADIKVETFSKGMKQRIQIARGLINDPEIIFMDEPTVGLDPIGTRMLRDIVKKLKSENRTILLTTHNMFEADELCDRIAIIKKGKLIALDTPQKIKSTVSKILTLEVVADGINDKHIESVKQLEGVESADTADHEKGKCLTIKYKSEFNINEKTLQALQGTRLVSLTNKELTLEDVYIALVGDEK